MYFYIGVAFIAVGSVAGLLVCCYVKNTQVPPWLLNLYALFGFLQSIAWINFASGSLVDLLQLFGFITTLPQALLSLTVLAWGNCLGDMVADVAMTKKGFGEMAITATVAGPIFNILISQGLANLITMIADPTVSLMDAKVEFSYKHE